MSSDLTRKEQLMFADKIGVPADPVYTDPVTNQDYVIPPGTKVPETLVKKGGRKTKKSNKRKSKKRSFLKSRKVR